jgi:CAAX prenyl protease-like protein
VVGVVLWVGICKLGLEQHVLALFGLGDWLPERVGFNPFQQLTDPFRRNLFLIFRFALLVVVVPVVEELFLRGWLVRYVEDPDWFRVKLSEVGIRGISAVAIYACATHPGEAVAAVVWFTLVSVLMVRTARFWNCVIAHAITNLLLGVYVISTGSWHLW